MKRSNAVELLQTFRRAWERLGGRDNQEAREVISICAAEAHRLNVQADQPQMKIIGMTNDKLYEAFTAGLRARGYPQLGPNFTSTDLVDHCVLVTMELARTPSKAPDEDAMLLAWTHWKSTVPPGHVIPQTYTQEDHWNSKLEAERQFWRQQVDPKA